jgi:hypothetical protein
MSHPSLLGFIAYCVAAVVAYSMIGGLLFVTLRAHSRATSGLTWWEADPLIWEDPLPVAVFWPAFLVQLAFYAVLYALCKPWLALDQWLERRMRGAP